EVVPPTVNISATYPGASAKVVADTVAAPIEQEVNGVENMLYMLSKSTNDGQMNLDVTFRVGTNLDFAQVLTQNRVSIAEAKLPEEVKRQGVTVKKMSPMILLCVNLLSPDGRYDQLYLSNYATIQVKDALARLPGGGRSRASRTSAAWSSVRRTTTSGATSTAVNRSRWRFSSCPAPTRSPPRRASAPRWSG